MPAAVDRVRARFPVVTHGLMMSLGGARPVRRRLLRRAPPLPRAHPARRSTPTTSLLGRGRPRPPRSARRSRSRARRRATPPRARARRRTGSSCRSRSRTSPTTSCPAASPRSTRPSFIADVLDESGAGLLARREQRLRQRAELRLRRARLPRAPAARAGRRDPRRRPRALRGGRADHRHARRRRGRPGARRC